MSDRLDRIREAVLETVFLHLDPACWEVWLFGSFATGRADVASDIDLAVRGPSPLPAATAARILADLEDRVPTLRDFDLVDLRAVPEALRRRVLTEGIPWNRVTTAA